MTAVSPCAVEFGLRDRIRRDRGPGSLEVLASSQSRGTSNVKPGMGVSS